MKKIIALTVIAALVLSTASFATAGTTPVTTPAVTSTAVTPAVTTAKPPVNLVLSTPVDASVDFSKTYLQSSPVIEPYMFELTEADFATSKWQKYIAAVYVQSTDINFYVSTLYADGALSQVILLSSDEVKAAIEAAKASNEAIRAESIASPDMTFQPFYASVYQKPWMLISEKILLTQDFIAKNDLAAQFPDLKDKLVQQYKLYQKGSFYILTSTLYPNNTWNSLVSSSIAEIDAAVGKMIAKNNELLVGAKLIEAPKAEVKKPVPTKPAVAAVPKLYYVLLINKDKTYLVKEFKTPAEANKYIKANISKYGKANIIYYDAKTKLDKAIKDKKLKKKK